MCHNKCPDYLKKKLRNNYTKIVIIPDAVTVQIKDKSIIVIGALGELKYQFHEFIELKLYDFNKLYIYIKSNNIDNKNKALVGTTHALVKNMIHGVMLGFIKKLKLIGIGYRVSIKDNILNLIIGLSHSINYILPVGIQAQCLNQTEIILNSINKQLIGQVAADLRLIRPPEPFKGKGIRYMDEIIINKDTKKR